MVKLIQTKFKTDNKRGNCLSTVIACLLDKSKPEDILQIQEYFGNDDLCWTDIWLDYIESLGYKIKTIPGHLFNDEFYMVSGRSERATYHICIYKNGKLFHDPHPDGTGLTTENEFEQLIKL